MVTTRNKEGAAELKACLRAVQVDLESMEGLKGEVDDIKSMLKEPAGDQDEVNSSASPRDTESNGTSSADANTTGKKLLKSQPKPISATKPIESTQLFP